MKRFLTVLLIAAIFFLVGVAVGRFVMPRKVEIMVIDINKLVDIIERYNEAKYEFDKIGEWNEQAITESEQEEQRGEK